MANLYDLLAQHYARQGIQNQNGTPLTAADIIDSDLDPLKRFAKTIAIAISNLRTMARKNQLTVGPQ